MPTITDDFIATSGLGSIGTSSNNFSTARGASSGTVDDPASVISLQTSFASPTYFIRRIFIPIDTSAIPMNATINSASLYFTPLSYQGNTNSTTANLVQTTQASTSSLDSADYDNVGSTSGGSISMTFTDGVQVNFALNATGIGFIVKKGITKIGLRVSRDIDNSAPTGLNQTQMNVGGSNYFLRINYTYQPSNNFLMFMS
jgi:hypothetical protein